MAKYYSEYYWHRLDNAAKIFPAISNAKSPNVYRFTARLTEPVQPELLQNALEKTLEVIPTFCVKMRRGLFWYYFETNFSKPVVKEDNRYPCTKIDKLSNNGYQLRVTYYKEKINLEVFHALADGTGALAFLKELLYRYLRLAHPDKVPLQEKADHEEYTNNQLEEDSFVQMERKSGDSVENPISPKAFHIEGVKLFGSELRVIQGIMPLGQVLQLAKSKNTTVTGLMVSLLLYSIQESQARFINTKKSLVACVPVNLRNYFKSVTLRNFFTYVDVKIPFYQKDYLLDEVIAETTEQLKQHLTKEELEPKINYNVQAQQRLALRVVPLFIKNLTLKLIHKRGEKGQTTTMSNMGRIDLPPEQAKFVERFEVMLSVTNYQRLKTALCSYGDQLVLSFTSGLDDTDIQRFFFHTLVQMGVPVTLACNDPEEEDNEVL